MHATIDALLRHALDVSGGWLSLADYMTLALHHPQHGYYRQGLPIGSAGDFITAPEISQVFGELIGAWCALEWQRLGAPQAITVLELGGGRGTLLSDALRATRAVAGFHAALNVLIVESSHTLRALQSAVLGTRIDPIRLHWCESVPDCLPERPMIVIANEFFDALPVRQFVAQDSGWAEVGVVAATTTHESMPFRLGLRAPSDDAHALIPDSLREGAPLGTVVEVCPQAVAVMAHLARHCARYGGAGLVIDYGYAHPPRSSTLQAIARHQTGEACADFLSRTGEVDLSTHVDMAALAAAAEAEGVQVEPLSTQGDFLRRLGIVERTAALAANASPAQRETLESGTARLINADAMGEAFKVLVMRGNDDRF